MTTYKPHLDRISILVSLLCMVHCIFLPVLFTTLPIWGFEVLENMLLEILTLVTTFVIGGWAIWQGHKKHHKKLSIPVLFAIGLAMMGIAVFVHSEKMEMSLKGLGAILVVVAHIRNWMKCRACAVCAL